MVLPLCGSWSGLNFMLLLYLRTIRPIASSYFYYVTTYIRTGPGNWQLAIGYWTFVAYQLTGRIVVLREFTSRGLSWRRSRFPVPDIGIHPSEEFLYQGGI